ncbi:hypothetical protein P3L51_32520 [Streptomyces sp. PSRA5]|uniref:hypothetical protein n=1 Tax=Streptomyces panacea TaxID=3035064 RepID=UPI00339C6CCB
MADRRQRGEAPPAVAVAEVTAAARAGRDFTDTPQGLCAEHGRSSPASWSDGACGDGGAAPGGERGRSRSRTS